MGKALLVIVFGFSTIFGTMMMNITSSQQLASETYAEQYEKLVSRNSRESITNVMISKALRDESSSGSITLDGSTCTSTTVDATSDSVTEAVKSLITISCVYDTLVDSTQILMMRPAYSYYGFFVEHNWYTGTVFSNGDTVLGPIHANAGIKVSGNPVFMGKVSTTETGFTKTLSSDSPKTYSGVEFGTDDIDLPNDAALAPLENVASSGGVVFTADANMTITFKADSSFDWVQGASSGNISRSSFNGVVYLSRSRDIHVKGIVAGQYTLLTEDDIVVDSSVVYKRDPRVEVNANDFLGLIAKDDFMIDDLYDNVEVDAAIICLDDYVVLDNYGVIRSNLTIYGSFVAHDDGASAEFWLGFRIDGYVREIIYDTRLKDRTPPYFPRLLNRKEIAYVSQ